MSGVSNAALLDLTKTTLLNLPNLEFEVALRLQEFPVCNQWFQGDKVQTESGTSIIRNIILDTSGNARHVRLFQKTPINVSDVHTQITAPWVQVQTHWSIERREILRNRAPARFIDLLKTRRVDATLDLAYLLEYRAWASPASASDDLNPMGLPYWLSMCNDGVTTGIGTATLPDFRGYTVRYAGGTSATTKGGIDGSVTKNANWRNYAGTYSAINQDFVKNMRRGFHATNFQSPILARDLRTGPTSKFRIYMGLDPLTAYEDMVTAASGDIGRDLDPFHGVTTFRRVPIIYTPQLDSFTAIGGSGTVNTPNPIFAVNHSHFFPMVLSGDWMREEEPMMDVEQHNVMTSFLDGSYQYFCKNVRAGGFVLHQPLTA